MREFAVDRQPIRVAVHHGGSLDEVDSFVRDVERIVREQRDIFGEFPRYEAGPLHVSRRLPAVRGPTMGWNIATARC